MRVRRFGIACWLLTWLVVVAICEERLRLIHAGSLTGWSEKEETVRELVGDVFFRQDSTEIHCDRALQYVERAQVRLSGHVLILDPPKRLRAGEVWYHERTRDYQAIDTPSLQDTSRTLHADTLIYREKADQASAIGRVLITEKNHRVRLQGQRAEYWRLRGYALVIGQPFFTELDSTGVVVMTVSADSMEMFEDGRRYQLSGRVHVRRDSIDAYCGRLTYRRQAEKLYLTVHPRAERGADVMRGQEMEISLRKNEITGITLVKQSVVISRVDTSQCKSERYDLLTGDRIEVTLQQRQVAAVIVKGQATSYYHLFEDRVAKGVNKVIGDEMHLFFQNGAMDRIIISSAPGSSSGVFYPPEKATALTAELEERLAQARSTITEDLKKRRDGKR